MSVVEETIRGPLLARPGKLETPGSVKRRLLVVAAVMALAVTGAYTALGSTDAPWSPVELRDMAGLPRPPAPFAPTQDGDIRALSPVEYRQLQEIRGLIERFPVPDAFANARPSAEEEAP
jgi:hypothetical protein